MKKAIFRNYGNADSFEIVESPLPEPSEGEVLVKVLAAGINPVDYKIRNGSMKWIVPMKLPHTPGGEIAGIVEKTNGTSSTFQPGDQVYAMLSIKGGGYSENLCVQEHLLCPMPKNLSFDHAAAIPLAALTALQALRDKGKIKKGMKVLINGASGGVGSFAVQLAKAFGAHTTTVCSEKNIEFVKSLGADYTINYQKQDFTTLQQSYDIVFDTVAKSSYKSCKKILTAKGIFISTLPDPSKILRQLLNPICSRNAFTIMVKPDADDLRFLNTLILNGKLNSYIESTYPLNELSLAHKRIETGRVRGKLVITLPHQ